MGRTHVVKGKEPANLFQGDWMICAGCSTQRQSNDDVRTGWTFIKDETGNGFDLCPQCFSDWMIDAVEWWEG